MASIGSIGDSYDNAMAESLIGLYKSECVRRDGPIRTVEDLELVTASWAHWFNTRRLHTGIGNIPPVEYEQTYYLSCGSTRWETDFARVYADAAMGARGRRVAEVILDTIDEEIDAISGFFGDIALPDLPLAIVVARLPGIERAYHHAPDATTLFVDARTVPAVEPRYTRFLVAALLVDLFAVAHGRGWSPADSLGEALSRALATSRYPRQIAGFATASAWLDGDREDYVNAPPGPAHDPVAVGAAVLFLNWLHYQLGHSWADIVAFGASTLAETYHRLATGDDDVYSTFRAEIDRIHPPGTCADLAVDNPYPRARPVVDEAVAETEPVSPEPEDEIDGGEPEPADEEMWSGEELYVDVEDGAVEPDAADVIVVTDVGDVAEWIEEPEAEPEVELRGILDSVMYPASRKRLVEAAVAGGASDRLVALLRSMPTRRYSNGDSVLAVFEEIG